MEQQDARDEAIDSGCCGIYVTRDMAKERFWILKEYPLYFIDAFIECMICVFALLLVAPWLCHSFFIAQLVFASCILCDCATRPCCCHTGRRCSTGMLHSIRIANALSAFLNVAGGICMIGVVLSAPSWYESPSYWTPPRRRLQTLRPLMSGITNLQYRTQCDECMSVASCFHVWDRCPYSEGGVGGGTGK